MYRLIVCDDIRNVVCEWNGTVKKSVGVGDGLLDCCAVWSFDWMPTFWRNILSPSSFII
jgi:hypothetical protein